MNWLTFFLFAFLFILVVWLVYCVVYGIRHPRTQEEIDLEQREFWEKMRAIEKGQIEKEARTLSNYYNKLITDGMPERLAENLTRSYQIKVFRQEESLGPPVIDDGLH